MPISYRIDGEARLLLTTLHQPATLADVRSYVAETIADPAYTPQLVEVVDASELVDPDAAAAMFDAARLLTDVWMLTAPARRVRGRVWIAPTPLLQELAVHYQRETVSAGVPVTVVRTREEAIEWARRLLEQPPDDGANWS
jgi:hypothetical protein